MKWLTSVLTHLAIVFCVGLNSPCSLALDNKESVVFVGCTPGDDFIKSQLGIAVETKIDFIRWDLTFEKSNRQLFVLHITYGESQPNTLDFKAGGQKQSYQGEYTITTNKTNTIYHLKNKLFKGDVLLAQLNDNLFHFLTPEYALMNGNGGWSYTLNNKTPNSNNSALPLLRNSSDLLQDTSAQVIFNGRTPCQDFAAEHQMKVSDACFKLKWKLVLNRDAVTHAPTTYTMRKIVDNIPRDVSGNWAIVKGTASNPDAVIYQLDPDKPKETISMLVVDENILLFLHKDKRLYVGNDNFSFTLNKKEAGNN